MAVGLHVRAAAGAVDDDGRLPEPFEVLDGRARELACALGAAVVRVQRAAAHVRRRDTCFEADRR
jgi:hypothetical protein